MMKRMMPTAPERPRQSPQVEMVLRNIEQAGMEFARHVREQESFLREVESPSKERN